MLAFELSSKLNNLTLVGYDGEYQWIGTWQEWDRAEKEEFTSRWRELLEL